MRNLWYSALAAALVLSGCQKVVEETPVVGEGQTISFIAETSVVTKSSMTIDGSTVKYSWTDEDTDFHVFYGDSEASPVVPTRTEDGKLSLKATFEQGVLPSSGNVSFTGYLNGTIKSVQTMDADNGSYDPSADVMIARASVPAADLSKPVLFQFKRMVSVAKLTLSGIPSKADRIIVSADTPILGSYDKTGKYTPAEGVIEVNGIGENNVAYFTLAPVSDVTLSVTAFTKDAVYVGETNGAKTFTAGNVRGTTVTMTRVTQLFKETFDASNGTGGNDGKWTGSIASSDIQSDNEWTFNGGKGANACAKFGTADAKGSATTPTINFGSAECMLTFKAAAWDNKDENTMLCVSVGENWTTTVDLIKGEWTTYRFNISGVNATSSVKFEGRDTKNNRFFLDEVVVYTQEEYVETRSKLATPSNVLASVDGVVPNKIDITWDDVESADGYEIVLSCDEHEDLIRNACTNTLSVEGLEYSTTYYVKIKATNSDAASYINSEYSSAVQATTGAKPEGVVEWISTGFSDLKTGDQVVIVRTSGEKCAMANDKGTTLAPSAIAVSVINDKLAKAPETNIIWYVEKDSADKIIFNADKAGTKWLYCTATNNGVRVGTNSAKSFTLYEGYLEHVGTSRYVGVYNDADWRCYTSNKTNIGDQTFAFFVKVGGSVTLERLEWTDYTDSYDKDSEYTIDGTINAVYDNGEKVTLSPSDVTLTTPPTMSVVGQTTAEISYTSGGVTKTATAYITITDPGQGGGSGKWTPATMAAGTNGSEATVSGKDAIKVGTNSKGGDMTITVAAGATKVRFYAAAWNSVIGLSLKITPEANVTITTVDLTADTGVTGNSPFTLSEEESSYFFEINLSDITDKTTLTLTSSLAKRFVVWGAEYYK